VTRRLLVVLRSQCRDGAMYAMAAQVLGTSRSVPLDALQSFRKVLGEKEKHEAVASEASLRSQVERSEMTRVQANNATIVFRPNATALQRMAPALCTHWKFSSVLATIPCPPAHRLRDCLATLVQLSC
jgi:hypothetical protein